MTAVKSPFGAWLASHRADAGITKTRMAAALGMAWSHYCKLEKDQVGPPRDYGRLQLLAEELDLPVVEVYERAGALPPDWLELARLELARRDLAQEQNRIARRRRRAPVRN